MIVHIFVQSVAILNLMSLHMMVLVALHTVSAPAVEQSSDMMIRPWLILLYVQNGFLMGCAGGVKNS